MAKSVTIILLGDFFFDARCINMADTILDARLNLNIINTGNSKNSYRGKRIYHISLPKRGFYKYIKFHKEVKNVLTEINSEIIIAGDLFSLPVATSIKDAHVIYDSREIYTQLAGLSNNPLKQKFWSWVEKKNITKTKSVLVTADGDGIILKNLYPNINITKIYNFPSIELKPSGSISLRKKFNISAESKIFLYQGVLHKNRGIKTIIKLLENFQNAHAVIIGDGPYRDELQKYAVKRKTEKRTHFYGAVPYLELLELSADADIGFSLIKPVSKSYEQALPNKLFEYALAGIPVIASNLPEMDKIINKYQIGYTVAHDEINAQTQIIKKILNENNRLEIQKKAEQHLVWESQKKEFLISLGIHKKP